MKGTFINLDSKDIEAYIKHLRGLSYRELNNGVQSLVGQAANDIMNIYSPLTPIRQRGGEGGKYKTQPGNLRKSLRKYRKRQDNPFIVEWTVGYRTHEYSELQQKIQKRKESGKPRTKRHERDELDGYYGFFVGWGRAGVHGKGGTKYIPLARAKANRMIETSLTDKTVDFIEKKLQKAVDKKGNG